MRVLPLALLTSLLLTSPALGQTLTISLPPPAAAHSAPAFHFEKLVDARPDRSRLGAVHRGLDNKLASANFEQSMTLELTPWFQQALPASPDTRPVVVRVHALSIGESITATSETAAAELVIDFLEPVGPDAYRLLLSTGELVESKGLDVTKHHPRNLQKVLEQSLTKLAALPSPASAETTGLLTWAQVTAGEDGTPAQRYPVQQEPLKRGVYRSFEEFRANAPNAQAGPFELVKTPRTAREWVGTDNVEAYYLYLDEDHPRRLVRDAWGLSDGQTAYIRYRNRYFPLTPAGSSFSFTGFRPADPNDLAAVATMGIMFGLVGSLVTAATLPDRSQRQPYDLHLTTGRVVAQMQPTVAADGFLREDTAAVYLYRRPDAQPNEVVRVRVGGREVGQLAAGSYLAFGWHDRQREMQLCVGTQEETCKSFVPDFTTTTYLECSLPSGTSTAPGLQTAPEKEGVFYVKKYRLRQRKP